MTVSNAQYLKDFYDRTRALGSKVISSDFAFEIEGFEDIWLLAKQCPWPSISPAGEIEIPTPLGSTAWQPQQIKNAQQGQITLQETVLGNVNSMLLNLLSKQGTFNAKIYEGTPGKFLMAKRIVDCFMVMDNPDRDWENRSQVLTFSGTLFFHYFGEDIPGNSTDYR
jgi:hypothetical protein